RVEVIGPETAVGSVVSMASSADCSLCRSVPPGRRKVHAAPRITGPLNLYPVSWVRGVGGVVCRTALFHGAHGRAERRGALRGLLRRRRGGVRGTLSPLSGSARPAPRAHAERSSSGR